MEKLTQIDFNQIYSSIGLHSGSITIGASLTLGDIITALLPYIYAVVGILLLLYLISGGISLMTAAGDPKKTQGAKTKITNAFIGFIIVFVSYWIVIVVGEFLGLDFQVFP